MPLFDTLLPSASPAQLALPQTGVPVGDGPGYCVRCEGEPGRLGQWRMRLLERAAESAVMVLEKITADVVAGETTGRFQIGPIAHEGDLGLIYSRISKALRQTLALHARFEEDSYKTQQERAAEAAARQAKEAQRAAAVEAGLKAKQKRLVKQAVTLAMDAEAAEDEERGAEARDYTALYAELHERLTDYDDYSDFGTKPISEVVEGICKVLGLKFDPALWEDEPWAIEEAKAKPAAAPAAEWPGTVPETANDDEDDEGDDPFGLADRDDQPQRGRGIGPP